MFDGAFGTWMQDQDLGPDDFGGDGARGLQRAPRAHPARPHRRDARRVLRGRRRRGRDRHVRRLRRSCSPSTASPTRPTRSTTGRAAHRPGGRRRATPPPDRPRFVDRLDRPRHQAPVARPDPLRRAARRLRGAGRRPARGRRRRAAHRDRATTCSRRKAAIIGCRRAMAAAGRAGPAQVQVTIETTGRMLVGSEIGAALTALEAMQPDVIGINCATGPAEMTEHLRYLAQHARTCRSRACPTPACRRSSTATRTTTSRPTQLADAPRALRHRVRRQHRRRLLRHDARAPRARSSSACRDLDAGAAHAGATSPACSSIYSPVPFHQDARVPDRSASAPTPTARRSSARRCSRPTGTPACRWPASR